MEPKNRFPKKRKIIFQTIIFRFDSLIFGGVNVCFSRFLHICPASVGHLAVCHIRGARCVWRLWPRATMEAAPQGDSTGGVLFSHGIPRWYTWFRGMSLKFQSKDHQTLSCHFSFKWSNAPSLEFLNSPAAAASEILSNLGIPCSSNPYGIYT